MTNIEPEMEIHDVFGIKPYGEVGLKITEAAIKGVSAFLEAVCKPGAEELGYMIKDQVRRWRLNNILRMLEKAKGKLSFDGQELKICANARVGLSIMEESSEVDDDELQDLWAGLFVSSCTPDGRDDSNMNFVDLLRRMSSVEARILDYACNNCKKVIYPNRLILADEFCISFEELSKISGTDDIYRLDSELDHMRSLELLMSGDTLVPGGGFQAGDEELIANITPSSLALSLFYKTHAIGISPVEFWGEKLVHGNEKENVIIQ